MHKKIVVCLYLIFLTGCSSKEKYIPQEGVVMTWKQNPQLIVKAKLGPRREHIVDTHCKRCEREFYRPEREHYLGQFPIDYVPENFSPITQEEADSLPMPDSNRQLQFNLMLRGSIFQATDGYIPDHKDQVRVRIEGLTMDMREQKLNTYKIMLMNTIPKYVKVDSKFKKFGLICYRRIFSHDSFNCYGKSRHKDVTGVFLHIIALENTVDNRFIQIMGNSYEPNKYGGVWVKWETNLNNWDKWQEIDDAIWRLLDAWNAAPSSQKSN